MKPTSRRRRCSLILIGLLLAYTIAGFLVAPPLVRTQIEKRATAALHRDVTIAKMRMNPFAMSVTVEGLKVTDHGGGELASWARAYVNVDPLTSLFRWEWRVGAVHLQEPRQRLRLDSDGALNIADLLVRPPEATPPPTDPKPALPRVSIGLLRVEQWAVDFTDQSRPSPFHTVVGPMTFELRDFSTQPETSGPYSFAGASDTVERFAWTGTISAAPFASAGRIEFQNVSLPHHMPFLEERLGGEIKHGRVSLVVNYKVAAGTAPVLQIENTTVAVEDLRVGFRDRAEPAFAWTNFAIELAEADLLARTAKISRIALTGLDAHVQRSADGKIDLLSLLKPASAPAAAPVAPADPGPAASVRIAEIALVDARIRITDHTTARPGTLALDQINVTATNAGTDLDREIKLAVQARWDGSGTLGANGVVRVLPFATALEVEGTGITLSPLDPWIETAANIRIGSGTERFRGQIEATQPRGGPLALTWSGDTGIDNLVIRDGATGGDLLSWQSLAFTNTRFTLDPLELTIAEVALVAPTAQVTIDETGTSNLTALRPATPAPDSSLPPPTPPSEPASPGAPPETTPRPPLPLTAKIDAITITGGTFSFTDRATAGGFSTALRDFGGSIRGLSSTELARADVDLAGSLDGIAPLRITGTINPLAEDRFSDVTVSFSNIDLPLFTPYGARFLGKHIQQGKLRVDLNYRVSQNTLEAENQVVFDQFYLGETVASPDAVKLPIGLALALLRDREGRINLDVPVRGRLDDPEFKYGRVVMQVISNVVVKAATAPFALLGGMFGGKEQDLSYIDFSSGSAELTETATSKLDVLAKSLFERPALRLEISSPPAPEGDRAGLRDRRLLALLHEEKRRLAPPNTEPEIGETADVALTPEETETLVRSRFTRQFPAEAMAAATATGSLPSPATAAEDDASRPGLLVRIAGSIFRRGGNSEPPPAPAETTPPGTTPPAEAPPPLTLADMQTRLLESIELTDADFQELAAARARVTRERLLVEGTIEAERAFLVTEPKVPEGANSAIEGGRVFFGLE